MHIRHVLMILMFTCYLGQAYSADLETAFHNPPEETKPWCYWYWLKGNISKDGITNHL